jgi:hypothetical protein
MIVRAQPCTATHDRAHSNATMRSHAPQPQTQITQATTADPATLLRGPPEAQNTIVMRRASNERPIRTQCKGDPQLPPARNRRGGIFGPESPRSTASGCSRDQHPTKKRPAEAETPNPDEAQIILKLSCLRALTCAANMGDQLGERKGQCISQKGRSGLMQQGRKSSGGRGLPNRAAEEQATTRGRKRVRKAFQAEILYVHCLRFSPGPFYIVADHLGLDR